MGVRPPRRHRKNVVSSFRLRFGSDGQKEFVALARDVIDLNLDLFLLSPFVDEIGRSLVGTGYPVVPETYR